jgi:hypothetical protein
MLRRINISAALIVLVCFFLPWVQVSCGGATQTLSGFDLARDERVLLWLVPIAMIAVLAIFLWRSRKGSGATAAILSAVSGAVTALLLNRERMRAQDSVALITAQLTGWFWLSFIAALAIVISSIGMLVRKRAT